MSEILLETEYYNKAKLFASRNHGKVSMKEDGTWIVESNAIKREIEKSENDLNKMKEEHQFKKNWLNHIESELDHVEKFTGDLSRSDDITYHARFPEKDIHDFHKHLSKKNYKLDSRDAFKSEYSKKDEGKRIFLTHHHNPNEKMQMVSMQIHPNQEIKKSLDEAKRGRPSKNASENEEPDTDKHIIMQLRKAMDFHKPTEVVFASGKELVSPGTAHAAVIRHTMLKPADKEAFQNRISKSHDELQKAIREAIEEDISENKETN